MLLIFLFSAQPAAQSDTLSVGLLAKIIHVFIPQFDLFSATDKLAYINQGNAIIRKSAHVFIYFVLALLFLITLKQYGLSPGKKHLSAILLCLLYASTDEIHQIFVSGRGPSILDVGIDLLGILAGLGVFAIVHNLIKKRA
ncbi:hypothetical protein SDC9_180148 [bioreactor metagenome]|uniref:VanZ-like domain-containing protein n=1 Tax=bioreactor metagenome TaxID=1076179 RepID=A0A645H106_9ZZZZ